METIKLSTNNQETSNFSSQEWLSYQAVAKHKEGKLEEAIAFYLEIVAINSNQPCSLYINLISLLTKVDMLDRAIEIAQQALIIHSDSDVIQRDLGLILGKKRNFDDSIICYEKALQIESLQPEWVFINLVKTLKQVNRMERALQVCASGLKYYDRSEYLSKIQLDMAVERGDWQQVQTILSQNSSEDGLEQLKPKNIFLLNEYTIYLECSITQAWNLGKLRVLIPDKNGNTPTNHWFVNEENCISFVISLTNAINFNTIELFLICDEKRASIKAQIANRGYGLESIDYINTKSNYSKCIIKENIIHGIIKDTTGDRIASSQELITKLESFVRIAPQLCNDISAPFSIYFDLVIPIHSEGLFLNGWMSDPFDMLEEIEAISSLGFALPIKNAIHYVDRPDINQAINQTSYKGVSKQLGVIAYIPFPQEIRAKFKNYAKQYSFRFRIKLRGNVSKEVIPPTAYYSGYSGMNNILNSFASNKVNTSLFKNCIAPAVLAMGKVSSQESTQSKTLTIGRSASENSIASIIIPISKNFDLFKVQFAMMANDISVRNSELIYILNCLDHQHQWERILESYSNLYDIPVKLITTQLGNDYGAIANIGATQAKSDLCISMLPDVLPKTQNWVGKMADFYSSRANPGVLTPKLIYEDLSIQHAGMTFEKAHGDSWSYKHFYQGLSSSYLPAQNSRPVPAVNGACMMFSRNLHQQVKGFSTEYLVPDSEASDFCFKSIELGYENWYFSEVEMYYFEKQNYFTDFINQYNLESQSKKWHDLMTALSNQ